MFNAEAADLVMVVLEIDIPRHLCVHYLNLPADSVSCL